MTGTVHVRYPEQLFVGYFPSDTIWCVAHGQYEYLELETPVAHEHRPGYACPACGHLALRQVWMGSVPDQANLDHQRLAATP